jgi:hypothetical protein
LPEKWPMSFGNENEELEYLNVLLKCTECPKNMELMGILIILFIFIYMLKLKVKRLKNGIKIGWKAGDSAWGLLKALVYALKIRDHLTQRIADCCATVDPNILSEIRTNMVKRLRK